MNFKIKTEPVCVCIVTIAALTAINRMEYNFSEGWYTITVITFVLILAVSYIAK